MQRLHRSRRLACFGALTLAVACGTVETLNEPIPQGMDLAASGGGGQSGPPGSRLPIPISVNVLNVTGGSVEGVLVTWTTIGASGSVSPTTSISDANGNATTVWTLGGEAGIDSLRASIETGASIVIIARVTGGSPGTAASNMVMVSANPFTLFRNQTSSPLVVRVTDASGSPKVNADVSWSITGGGALSSTSTRTDANGQTQVTVTASSVAATYSVTASHVSATPLVFTINVP
jgi:adhesin/invasin